MKKLNVNLKFIPDVDGGPKVAQLVGYYLEDIDAESCLYRPGAVASGAACQLPPGGFAGTENSLRAASLIADLTLPYGKVLHDYLA